MYYEICSPFLVYVENRVHFWYHHSTLFYYINSNICKNYTFFWGYRIFFINKHNFGGRYFIVHTVPAQILRQYWLERHVSILFSKICQFLTFYLVKSSPKNPRWKLERRRSICAGTVYENLILKKKIWTWYSVFFSIFRFFQVYMTCSQIVLQ